MKKLVLALCLAVTCVPAMASGNSNIKVSLWGDIAVAAPNNNIDDVKGLDIGIGSTAEEITGVQLDFIYANAKDKFTGIQSSYIYSVTPEFQGWQSALFAQADHFVGLQSGAVTYTKQDFTGVQWGFVNLADSFTGAQLGFVNYSKSVNGVQFGFVNYTENIYGIQLGLANIARNGFFPAMIFINGRL